jgi:putative transposase
MKTSKFTDSQIMAILKQAESGTPVAALCREHGMSMRPSINGVLNMAVWIPH